MCKRVILVVSLVAVLGLVNSSSAINWDNGGSGESWCTPQNWAGDSVPGPSDEASIIGTITGPTIDCDVNVNHVVGPLGDGQTITITSGNIVVHNLWTFSDNSGTGTIDISGSPIIKILGWGYYGRGWTGPACGTGIINISGDPNIYVQDGIRGADSQGCPEGDFQIYMSGGYVSCNMVKFGDDSPLGTFEMTGGTFIVRSGGFEMTGRNGAVFDFTLDGDSYLEIAGGLSVPSHGDAIANMYLNDGILVCGDFSSNPGAMWTVDIDDAIMKIVGDKYDKMKDYVDNGRITGYDGTAIPDVVWDGTYTLVGNGIPQEKAYSPRPRNGTGGLCPNTVTISWTPGQFCVDDHNVYFGTDRDEVEEGTALYAEHYAANSITLTNLDIGETYFWRVDEVNDSCDASPWIGSVWQFSTEPGAASDPSPPNNRKGLKAEDVDSLSWSTHCIADTHNLYFGTDLPASIVLFEDDFESGSFTPKWSVSGSWEIFDANGDPNFGGRDANMAKATGSGDLITTNINATNGDPCAMRITFYIRKTADITDNEIKLYYYDGSSYDYIADLNSFSEAAQGANDVWLYYTDTVTDSQYFKSNFKIKLEANITGGIVYIDDVTVTNTWPTAAQWYEARVAGTEYELPEALSPMTVYYWRVDTVIDGNVYQGPHWKFSTGYGGLIMYYPFDGTQGNDLPSQLADDTGNVTFTKYLDPVDPCCWIKYGESNPLSYGSTASANFEPYAGLSRDDPCGPSELTRDILRLDGYQYTVEMWVKPRNLIPEENVYLISKRGSWGIEIHTDNDYEFRWQGGGGQTDGDSVANDTWHHVAVVYDQTDEDLSGIYLNGDKHDGGGGLLPSDNNSPLWIGARVLADGNLGNYFNGMIDEIRVHDIALRPCAFLMDPREPEYPKCPTPEDEDGDVDPCGVVLSWTPGESATSHIVYFGTNYDDVYNLDISVRQGEYESPESNSLDLDYGTTYYWRVDGNPGQTGDVWRFTTQYQLADPSMQVWYKFDETSGDDAFDSSGYGRHADVEGDDPTWIPGDPAFSGSGGCLEFDDDIGVDVSDDVLDDIDKEITISVWLKGSPYQNGDMVVLDVGGPQHPLKMSILVPDATGNVIWRAGNDSNDLLVWRDATPEGWQGDWHHLVFIKDDNAGTMSVYIDAILGYEKGGTIVTLPYMGDKEVRIGAYTQNEADYIGRMDDFRIYNYAFTEDDVAALFRGGDVERAWAPNPYDGQPNADYDTDLSWRPGDYAASHDVYFGTNWDEVNDANSNIHPNVDYNNVADTNYDVGILELDKTYYWRVDEVNDACDPNGWKGYVWRFKVAEYVVIDDMEDYTEGFTCDYPITSGSCSEYGWDSSYSGNGTGSSLFLSCATCEWSQSYHGGHKAMYYYYDITWDWGCGHPTQQDCFYAEISNHFTMDPCDWEVLGLKMLALWFYGTELNASTGVEQMYVGLEDSSGIGSYSEARYGDGEGEDINDITIEEWQEWNIPLSTFTNVDLSRVEKIYIGFGERYGAEPGGEGTVLFDDIRLYQATCVPWLLKPDDDLNNDCIVDFDDVKIIADEWLKADVNLGPVTKPDDANLLGWWTMDEGTGSDAYDYSSNSHHGTVETIDTDVWWVTGRNDVNSALDFDGGRVRVADAAALRPLDAVSATAWIKYSASQNSARVVVKGADNRESYSLEVSDDGLVFNVRDGNDPNAGSYDKYDASSGADSLNRDEWIHVAGTFDGSEVKCYINGQLKATGDGSELIFLSQDTNDLAIGNRSDDTDRPFVGTIDDVRVYDHGLSAEEVRYLATDGNGWVAMQSIANLVSDEPLGEGAVNLRDFAALADSWLEEKLYPQ